MDLVVVRGSTHLPAEVAAILRSFPRDLTNLLVALCTVVESERVVGPCTHAETWTRLTAAMPFLVVLAYTVGSVDLIHGGEATAPLVLPHAGYDRSGIFDPVRWRRTFPNDYILVAALHTGAAAPTPTTGKLASRCPLDSESDRRIGCRTSLRVASIHLI